MKGEWQGLATPPSFIVLPLQVSKSKEGFRITSNIDEYLFMGSRRSHMSRYRDMPEKFQGKLGIGGRRGAELGATVVVKGRQSE